MTAFDKAIDAEVMLATICGMPKWTRTPTAGSCRWRGYYLGYNIVLTDRGVIYAFCIVHGADGQVAQTLLTAANRDALGLLLFRWAVGAVLKQEGTAA